MKQQQSFLLIALLATLVVVSPLLLTPAYGVTALFKVDGYVTDSTGVPIAGAAVIFSNVTVPYIETNASGYYSVNAPAGTYHLYVWPPYDSHYINGEVPNFQVTAPTTQNITLVNGCKVSSYVYNESGVPMVGAGIIFFTNSTQGYGSGYFTTANGYYYANLQPGTYTIDAHPQTRNDPSYAGPCTNFTTYTETGFAITGDVVKNLTVTTSPTTTPSPTPAPTQSPSSGGSSSSSSSTTTTTTHTTAKSTPTPTPTQPTLTLNTQGTFHPTTTLNLTGQLQDQNGNPLNQKTIMLTYQLENSSSWVNIGTAQTDIQGNYQLPWCNPFSSDNCAVIIKATYTGDTQHLAASNSTTLQYATDQNISTSTVGVDSLLYIAIAAAIIIAIAIVLMARRR